MCACPAVPVRRTARKGGFIPKVHPEVRPFSLTFSILTGGALGMAALLALIPAAGHDQLWFLMMAERWLAQGCGRHILYGPTAFDPNTPAIVWLSAIPVALAHGLHVGLPCAAKALMALLEGAIALFAAALLAPAKHHRALFAFVFVTLFAVVPARDFGQRDLLTVLLCLPYLVCAARSLASQTTAQPARMTAAVLAAAGVCLKPQLALVPLAVELFLFVRSRRRFEPILFLLTGGVFLGAIRAFAPLYFTRALPATRATYWAVGHLTAGQLVAQALELHILAAVAVALAFVHRRSLPATARICLVAAAGALFSYFVQGTGWYYQQLPAIILFAFAAAFTLLDMSKLKTYSEPPWLPPAAADLSLLALVLTFHFSGYPFALHPFTPDRTYAIESPDPSFFRDLPPGTPVATLTTSVDDAIMPVFRYHLTWAQRTNNLWTLPAIVRATAHPTPRLPQPRLDELITQQRHWMIEDLTRWKPQLILIARCQNPGVHCQMIEELHPDLLAFFAVDPAFAQVFRHYRYLRSQGSYDAYILTP